MELVSGFLRITQLSELVQYWLAFKQMADSAAYGANARSLISAALSSLS